MAVFPSPVQQAVLVIHVTMLAWDIRAESSQARARRAPRGYEPLRVRQRRYSEQAPWAKPLLAYSW